MPKSTKFLKTGGKEKILAIAKGKWHVINWG